MNRNLLVSEVLDASRELVLTNPVYARQVKRILQFILHADRQTRDCSLYPARYYRSAAQAIVKAKSTAIVAGLEEVQYFLRPTGLEIRPNFTDGQKIEAGEILLTITGPSGLILTYERTILNVLQRLSGIATATHRLVNLIADTSARVAATRKTLWGWLDKRAVARGGGVTHRLGLFDGAMLKENHLAVLLKAEGTALTQALSNLARQKIRFIEVEVQNSAQFWQLVAIFQELPSPPAHVLMFDHFTPSAIAELIARLRDRNLRYPILLEASGNITEANIRNYALSGVDIISVGSITHSTPSSDFSLLITSD